MRSQTRKYILSTLFATLLFCVGSINAQAYSEYDEPSVSNTHRPILALRASVISGVPDIIGISGSLMIARPFELEVGISSLVLGWTFFAKAGGVIPLLNTRRYRGRGWTLDLQLMAGYRYIGAGDLFGTGKESHGITATVGFDLTFWLANHFGITTQLNGGVGYFVKSTTTSQPFFPDIRLSIGLAF